MTERDVNAAASVVGPIGVGGRVMMSVDAARAWVGLTRPPRPDEVAFLCAIAADPQDDALRLIFADYLDEHDDPGNAALVRAPRVHGPDLTPGRWSVCRREPTWPIRFWRSGQALNERPGYLRRLRRVTIDIDRVTRAYATVRGIGWWNLDTLDQCVRLDG